MAFREWMAARQPLTAPKCVQTASRVIARALVVSVLASSVWACSGSSPQAPTPPVTPPVEPVPQPPPQPPPPPTPPPTPPAPTPKLTITKFMAFGDSLTEGQVSPAPGLLMRLVSPQAYPGRLQAMLAARYTDQTPVVSNQGVSGERAEDGVSRFVRAIRSENPEAVLLLDGINDIAAQGQQGQRGANAALAAMDTMMKEARNRRVAVFLATLPPERDSGTKAIEPSVLDRYNEDLRRLARGEGAVIVDLARDLDISLVGVDGIHLTEAGYERVATLFFQAIVATKEAPPAAAAATTLTRK